MGKKTLQMTPTKHYLGDSVYVQEEQESIVLTTEHVDAEGVNIISNAIYIEPETMCALQRYLLNRKVNPAGVQ